MTEKQRETLRRAIDAKVREKVESPPEPPTVLITDERIEETVDEETLARMSLVWRDSPWRLHTLCTQHGEMAWCAGPTRDKVICLACYIAGPTRTRKGRVMSTSKDKGVSLAAPFKQAVREKLAGVEIVEKAAYARVVEGKKTLAYINGDRKLRIEVALGKGYGPAISVTTTGEFAKVIEQIAKARTPAQVAETLAEATAEQARVVAAKTDEKGDVKPDPKPGTKKRGGRTSASAASV